MKISRFHDFTMQSLKADEILRPGLHKIFTALAASNASTVSEIEDWTIIKTFAQRWRTGTSVGENAVLVLKARKR